MLRLPRPRLPRLSKRRLLIVLALLVLAVGGLFLAHLKSASRPSGDSQNTQVIKPKTNQATTIRLIATGDFVPHDSINAVAKQSDGSYNYLPLMQNLKPFFDAADVRFCNAPVLAAGPQFRITGYPIFNAPTEFSRDMAKMGCNVINKASNHMFDKGQTAINADLDYWASLQGILAIAGANHSADEQNKISTFEVKGVKFALLAYTTYNNTTPQNSFGVNQFSRDFAAKQLAEAKTKADVIIVSMRWGTEYSPDITSNQDDIAQFLSDNGANLILGHGPHVLGPVKQLKGAGGANTLVWYSIGNFINTQEPAETLFGCITVMDIDIATKEIKNPACLPFYMHYEWSADDKAKDDLLKRHSIMMYTLDKATSDQIKAQQLDTTVDAQRSRITDILNKFTQVKILHDNEY